MPVIDNSTYVPPPMLRSGHALTIWASCRRKLPYDWQPWFSTVRLRTPDGDFFDVDCLPARPDRRSDSAVILSHGLEGNSRRPYVRGMAEAFRAMGWDALARNFRGCSGEPNLTPGMYHGGQTCDLHQTVLYAQSLGYRTLALVGFSMGGNQTLKYVGEDPDRVPSSVCAAVGVSTPCDLEASAEMLARPSRLPYMAYFLKTLRAKIREKHRRFPDLVDSSPLWRVFSFEVFDNLYTAPLHGFRNAHDYWRRASSLPVLAGARLPVLILNALDDPFLAPRCFPVELAQRSSLLTLEMPRHGGHVGFVSANPARYWSETRTVRFVADIVGAA
ncbi:MAG TPA: alpha/beta fold hydrolase [Candidatus Avidesulfovibrio excrementigallinarum]|nr:alpha/beta fold hydrolase [Candidatus Avidesulfovibrio excrementigallinarum]